MFAHKTATALTLLLALATPVYAHGEPEHGGQIVEAQEHQFELVVEPESKATHLDLYISDPRDKPVANAVVRMQITTPSGQKLALPLKYEGGHYTAMLDSLTKGSYKVVALTTIGSKKLNSRFAFKL